MNPLDSYIEIIARHSQRLDPIPTECTAEVRPLSDIRAVLFDVYGTMMVSGSGDIGATVGAAVGRNRETAAEEALEAIGMEGEGLGRSIVQCLDDAIVAEHQRKRSLGCAYPEVDIVRIWKEVLASPNHSFHLETCNPVDVQRVALEYEIRTNPVWPMPGLVECLTHLARSGMILGIISNAQFYTRLLFPALLKKSLTDLAFDPDVQYYSYRSGEAKPSETMYREAAEALSQRGVSPEEILYVGNDLLNDILPASKLGFQTALFAGDRRSLRLRAGDERVKNVRPDVVITHLAMLSKCVGTDSK